jgi:hypothetical protein
MQSCKDIKNSLLETLELIKENSLKSKNVMLNKRRTYNYWTFNEDEKLMRLAKELNYNWIKVSLEFINRTPAEVEKRWKLRIDPNTKKTPWTAEEDRNIIILHKKFGGNWKTISQHLEGRLPSAIKNRYYSKLQKTESNLKEINSFSTFDEENELKEKLDDAESICSKSTSVTLTIFSNV